MKLIQLLNRKTVRMLGVNSGTSADGLDFSLLELRENTRRKTSIRTLAEGSARYSPQLRALALELADAETVAPEKIALADEAFG